MGTRNNHWKYGVLTKYLLTGIFPSSAGCCGGGCGGRSWWAKLGATAPEGCDQHILGWRCCDRWLKRPHFSKLEKNVGDGGRQITQRNTISRKSRTWKVFFFFFSGGYPNIFPKGGHCYWCRAWDPKYTYTLCNWHAYKKTSKQKFLPNTPCSNWEVDIKPTIRKDLGIIIGLKYGDSKMVGPLGCFRFLKANPIRNPFHKKKATWWFMVVGN